ncbi:hypothetical protein LPB136_11820 [Tenacibaculum todarodis]|uniref:Glycine dehydrogenase n=1 Tax=Tenacibaculum todarodis TaxID=1850252 RepID=A0A1L3JLL3_9FLAO|nr:hypothetical protein [Tenacibaculum todarodis]APG66011.1 hypothetical protein LPB136_11820 [Tenacibaculum todarodis]
MFKNFIISCDEATTICDKSQYGEASFSEKLKLNWHIFVCKICSKYVKQNRTMTKVLKMKASDCKEDNKCLSNADKDAFKKELEKMEA